MKTLKELKLFEVVTYVMLKKNRIATIVIGFDKDGKHYGGTAIMNPKEKSTNLKLARKIARSRAAKLFKEKNSGVLINLKKIKDIRTIKEKVDSIVSEYNKRNNV